MSNEILNAVMELKQDVGEIKGAIEQMRNDKISTRVHTLELHRAHEKGRASALAMVGTFLGAGFGYIAQATVAWFKTKGHQ